MDGQTGAPSGSFAGFTAVDGETTAYHLVVNGPRVPQAGDVYLLGLDGRLVQTDWHPDHVMPVCESLHCLMAVRLHAEMKARNWPAVESLAKSIGYITKGVR